MSSTSMQWYRKMTARPILQKRRNVLKLIHLYQAKRVLWDRSCTRFRDHHARKAAWKDISSQFPCSADELKLKMNSLLGTYERERKKEMCPYCDRKDPREVYTSKWFAYDSFDFLRNAKPRPLRANLWDSDDNSENENENYRNAVFIKEEPGAFEQEDVEFDEDSTIDMDETVAQRNVNETEFVNVDSIGYGAHFLAQAELSSPPKIPVKRITVIKRKRPSFEEAEHTPKNSTSTPTLDECSTFVDHVRTKLEKFDNPDRAIIMHRINNAIFESEMNKYGHRNYFRSQPEGSVYNPVSIDPAPIPIECRWLKPVICIPKLDS